MRMRPLHTKTETNRQEQQTGEEKDPDSYSLRVSHCKSQLAVFPPSRCPSLQSCVDIRPVQKGSAQLIAGPLRVGGGGGVVRGQDMGGWRWGLSVCLYVRACVRVSSGSETRRLTPLPQIWRSRVRQSRRTRAARLQPPCAHVIRAGITTSK